MVAEQDVAEVSTPYRLPNYPIVFLGACGSATTPLAVELSTQGYQVLAGTRSAGKFDQLWEAIHQVGGVEPRPLVADVSDHEALWSAFDALDLPPGQPLHYFATQAGGLLRIRNKILRPIMPLMREARAGEVLAATAETATQQLKELAQAPELLADGMAINCTATDMLGQLLEDLGHLQERSVGLTLSSSPSNDYDPDNPETYKGPWFYYPIAVSKELGVRALEKISRRTNMIDIDMVAPEITGTEMGRLAEQFADLIRMIKPTPEVYIPQVSIDQVVQATLAALHQSPDGLSRVRKVYIDESGRGLSSRPEKWNQALLPYL